MVSCWPCGIQVGKSVVEIVSTPCPGCKGDKIKKQNTQSAFHVCLLFFLRLK